MKKILAIDDQKDNLTTIKAVIKINLSNCKVITALSGMEGIELAKNKQPDVILLDIIMPIMDGFEVCKKLKEEALTKHIPIIMITAIKTDSDSRVKGLNLGADAFLSKPIDPIELTAQINVMFRIKEAEDSLRKEKEALKEDVYDKTTKLQKSEERFRFLSSVTFEGIVLHKKGIIKDVNESFLKITGYTREEALGNNMLDYIPDIKDRAKIMLNIVKKYAKPYTINVRRKDGSTFIAELEAKNIKDFDNKTIRIVSIRDISARIEAEKVLRESEEKLRNIFENSTALYYSHTPEHKLTYLSPQVKNILGYTQQEALIKWTELASDNPINEIGFKNTVKAIETGKRQPPYELELVKKSGERIWAEVREFPKVENGKTTAIIGSLLDITERKLAEQALQNRERIYATLINNLPGFTYRCQNDKDWTMDYISDVCEDITGYSSDDFMSKKIAFNDIIDVQYDKKIRNLWEKNLKEKTTFEFEYQIITKNQEVKWIWERGCGVYSDNGEVLYLEGFITDVTEHKRAEQVQKVIYNISNAVVTSISLKDFIGLIKIELGTLLDTSNFYIAFYDEDADVFSSPFVSDEKDGFDTWPAGKSFSAYVLKTKKSLLVTKTEMLKMHANGLVDIVGTPSEVWMGVPLISDGIVNGVFAIQSYKDKKAYTKSDLEILEIIADQIAISIDRKQSDLKIEESEEILQLAVEVSNLGYYEWKSGFEYYHWSNQMYNIFELDINSDVDPHAYFISILHPEDKEKILKNIEQSLDSNNEETHFKNEYRIVCDERIKYIIANGIHFKDDNGNVIRIIGTCQDITDLKLAEQLIIESEERFALAMKASKDGLFDWNLVTNEIYYSENWKKMLGYKDDELPNKISTWQKLTHPEGREKSMKKMDWAIKNKIERYEEEFKMRHKQGHWVHILSRPEFVYNEKQEAIRVVGTHVDISKQREYERNLKDALHKAEESDRLKSTFLATMSHELRTPLNAIIGFSDIIDESLPLDTIVEFSKTINSSGNHLLNIVEDLFDITLIETGTVKIIKKEVEIQTILSDVHKIISVEKLDVGKSNLDINLKIPKDSKKQILFTDSSKLKQILINLLKNALKFTHEGSVQYGYSVDTKNNTFKFFVKDTGIGIPLAKQELIFDVFRQVEDSHTREYGGTGIGLSISKKLTELLGGEIWLESTEGKGTVFYFSIPYEADEVSSEKNIELGMDSIVESKRDDTKKKLVLIVEDVAESFEFLKVVLESQGMNTIWAENGKIAVDYCKINLDIDLVLMDINMPVMNGFEATKQIKEFNLTLPIIAQTAYAIVGDREKAIDAGCDDYLSKPINRDKLMKIIKQYIE